MCSVEKQEVLLLNLQINKNALLQYFAIYMSLQFLSGRVSLFLGSDLFYGFCLVFSAAYIFIHNRAFREDSKYFLYLLIIMCFALITTVFTGGALSIATTLSLLSRYLMVYVAIVSNREKFIERFLKMCYVLAITSVIIFAFVQIAGQDTAMRLMSPLYEIKNTLSWMPSSYGLFFIVYNFRNGNRNSYMFGEPGLYQMVIILALYFTVFKAKHLSDKQKARYVIVFLITMITIQSTTGFMSLIVLILCVIFSNGLKINRKIKGLIMSLAIAGFVYILFFAGKDSIIYTSFMNKLFDDGGSLNLAVGTGSDRVTSILRFVWLLNNRFMDFMIGIGYDGIVNYFGGYSCSGIVNSFMMFGAINCLVLYGYILTVMVKDNRSLYEVVFLLFMIINNGLSQPDMLAITTVFGFVYLLQERKMRGNINEN